MTREDIGYALREQFGRESISLEEAASVMDATPEEARAYTLQRVNPLPTVNGTVPIDPFAKWLHQGGVMMIDKKEISYGVRGQNARGRLIVWEYVGNEPVNEYYGYMDGDLVKLYPSRKLNPSSLRMDKLTVALRDTRREF